VDHEVGGLDVHQRGLVLDQMLEWTGILLSLAAWLIWDHRKKLGCQCQWPLSLPCGDHDEMHLPMVVAEGRDLVVAIESSLAG